MRRRDVASDHHRRELGPRDVADARASGDASQPQNDDAIADIEDFRQLVGDENDALPFGPEPPEDRQQFGNFARREIGGRLVEDQQLRVAQHRLEDLDPLPASKRQVGD